MACFRGSSHLSICRWLLPIEQSRGSIRAPSCERGRAPRARTPSTPRAVFLVSCQHGLSSARSWGSSRSLLDAPEGETVMPQSHRPTRLNRGTHRGSPGHVRLRTLGSRISFRRCSSRAAASSRVRARRRASLVLSTVRHSYRKASRGSNWLAALTAIAISPEAMSSASGTHVRGPPPRMELTGPSRAVSRRPCASTRTIRRCLPFVQCGHTGRVWPTRPRRSFTCRTAALASMPGTSASSGTRTARRSI